MAVAYVQIRMPRGWGDGPAAFVRHVEALMQSHLPAAALDGIRIGARDALPALRRATKRAPKASPRGKRGAVASGTYITGWETEKLPDGASVYNDVGLYAEIIELGRKPGARMPPVAAIEQWIRLRIAPYAAFKSNQRPLAPKGSLLQILNQRISAYSAMGGAATKGRIPTPAQLAALAMGRAAAAAARAAQKGAQTGLAGMPWAPIPLNRFVLNGIRRSQRTNFKVLTPMTDAEIRAMAWAIAKAIARRGLRERLVMINSVNRVANIVVKAVEHEVDKAILAW